MIAVTETLSIDEREIRLEFVRSSGPGGQNVNKVATAVQLRFDAARSPSLTEEIRRRLLHLAGKRATKEGVLVIDARRYRTQEQNRQDAVQRLVEIIRKAAEKPKPRKKTRPTRAAQEKRLEIKRRRSLMKRERRRVCEG